MNSSNQPILLIPEGTKVVLRSALTSAAGAILRAAGTVGVVVKSPLDATHAYRVRFPDGGEAALKRDQLSILRHFKGEQSGPGGAFDQEAMRGHIIYQCVVGSRAYGLDHEGSDTDRRGIYLPPAEAHWSLGGVPEQLEFPDTEECYWELEKFINLALKANPNILESLYSPLVERTTPLADELLAMRDAFLSKLVYQTFNGYVMSQFKKLEADLRTKGEVKLKHAMHLVRLLITGITILREGRVPVDVGEHREALLDIRHGRTPWEEIDHWRLALHRQFDEAYANSTLPERPDYERANAFLLRARRAMVSRPRVSLLEPREVSTGSEHAVPKLDVLQREIARQRYPLLFATVSGAHLYGFPSPDSDYDLRGAHLLPAEAVLRLAHGHETIEISKVEDGLEFDLVTHDAAKFFGLLLKKNGYVLEQVLSPLVVHTTQAHAELRDLARRCITRHHSYHYLGFVHTQWKLFAREDPPRVKPLLYVFRILLTGIHLMRTGELEANLVTLNESFRLGYLPELIERKRSGPEKGTLTAADVAFYEKEQQRLEAALREAHERSTLRESPSEDTVAQLNDLLVRLRLGGRFESRRDYGN